MIFYYIHFGVNTMTKIAFSTTFKKLRKAGACRDRYQKLSKHLGGVKKYGSENPVNILTILSNNGVQDCLWVIDQFADKKTKIFLGAKFAESVLQIFESKYPTVIGPRNCISTCFSFCAGIASESDLIAAEAGTRYAGWAGRHGGTWTTTWAAAWADRCVTCSGFAGGANNEDTELKKQQQIIRNYFN